MASRSSLLRVRLRAACLSALALCLGLAAAPLHANESQWLDACAKELGKRKLVVGMPGWREQMQECMARLKKLAEPLPYAKHDEMTPLGPGPVGSYMSALHAGDLVLVRRMDREHLNSHGALLWKFVFSGYLANYPKYYRSCLGADAPTVGAGRVYDEVRRDGFGNETRNRVDTRRRVPVKPALLPIAQSTGVETFTVQDEAALRTVARLPFLGEVEQGVASVLGRFRMGDFDRFSMQLMSRLRCDDPVILTLERQMLAYFDMRDLSDDALAQRVAAGAASKPAAR